MNLIDWRELYKSNQEAIARAGVPTTVPPSLPARPKMPKLARGLLDRVGRSGVSVRTPGEEEQSFTVAGRERRALVHVGAGVEPGVAVPLVAMLHGCTQDPATFAAATLMNEAADRHGFVAVYPRQERSDNQQGCWNWFAPEHQARDGGEPAALAGILRLLAAERDRFTIDARRVFVAGLSSGGAMTAILAATHPDLVAAVAIHSGLAYRAATGVAEAFAAMSRGGKDPGRAGREAHVAMGVHARPVPALVLQGDADRTVAPLNAGQVLEQAMTANRLAAPGLGPLDPARPTTSERDRADGGHAFTRARWRGADGALLHELITVQGMGHAWSGGTPGGSYTDPLGPDATEAICTFFAEARPQLSPRLTD